MAILGLTSPVWIAFIVISFIRWGEYRAEKKIKKPVGTPLDDLSFHQEYDQEEIENE